MQIKQPIYKRDSSIKTYPLQKSNSAAAIIINGGHHARRNSDYLMSFKKDFAAIDKAQRDKEQLRHNAIINKMKIQNENRQMQLKQKQQNSRKRLLIRQQKSNIQYNDGHLKSTLSYSIPVNPVNSAYLNNKNGENLAFKDQEKGLNRLVRSHYLHTLGNSGYNIITGKCSLDFDKIVPPGKMEVFQNKINLLYSQFKINPENL